MSPPPRSAYLLSPQAQRLFLEHADATPCTVAAELLTGPLDLDRLRSALAKVVGRHEVLRTTFLFRPGVRVPLQVVESALEPSIQVLGGGADLQQSLAQLDEAARQPFDLANGPLLRVGLFPLDSERHVLMLSCPSAIADAAGLDRVVAELMLIYGGQETALPAEPIQYADFSAWANERLAVADPCAVAGRDYWRTRPEPLPLRLVFEHDSREAAAEEAVELALDDDTVQRLAALARHEHPVAGLDGSDVLFLVLYTRVLALFSAEAALALRVSLDARRTEEVGDETAIGFYAQSIPISLSIDWSGPLSAAMDGVRASLKAAASCLHDLPDLPEPGASHPPIGYEVLAAAAYTTPQGLAASPLRMSCAAARCKLKLSLLRAGAGRRAFFYYDARRFRRDDVQRLAGTFAALCKDVGQQPELPLNRLDCVTEEERRLFAALNATARPIPPCGIHALFEAQAARTPDRLALVGSDRSYSYAALSAAANRVAHWLRAQGVGARDRVGLYVGRSAASIIGLLGILKAGAAYVPLPTDSPRARLSYQLEAVGAAAVLTETPLLAYLPPLTVPVACLDRCDPALAAQPTSDPGIHVEPTDLAYVIYTSGTTGIPKGVGISHRSLVNYARALVRRLDLESKAGLHFATVSTLAADLGNTSIFPPLIAGGCVHVLMQEVLMDGRRFAQYAAARPIDVLKITPSHLEALLDSVDDPGAILPQEYLITGGEPLRWELCSRVQAASRCRHLNHYGPTETTIGSLTYGPISAEDPAQAVTATVPIGLPIDNTEIYVLSDSGLPVPVGAPGELYIGGAGVARGYINEPQQTRERFVRHPFSPDPEARLYRTGDRVRCLQDGRVEFLGRIDRQLKIRGHRVEPGEIEQFLRRHPAVRQAAVLLSEPDSGTAQLLAFVVAARSPGADATELRRHLEQHLPAHMIPSRFVEVASVPLSANGKLDRRALLSLLDARAPSRTRAPLRTPIEAQVGAIWAQVLRSDSVGADDNFFDSGGHSLLATQLLARVRQCFPITEPSLGRFLAAPTVAALARDIEAQLARADAVEDALLGELASMSEEEAQKQLEALEAVER